MPWRRNIQPRSVEPSLMLMSHWNNGGTRNFAAAICPAMFLSTCLPWPASMPPIDMIVSHTMSKRSREGARQAAATSLRVTPSYSGQPTRSRRFRGQLEPISSRVEWDAVSADRIVRRGVSDFALMSGTYSKSTVFEHLGNSSQLKNLAYI
jgi:hypothetical protein